nr:MAG TPA: hypothetical protein [Caudoviricetes sp.]DAW68581.1 MAG TPA: hypothetical protein [Caudoviricetes sp.]
MFCAGASPNMALSVTNKCAYVNTMARISRILSVNKDS